MGCEPTYLPQKETTGGQVPKRQAEEMVATVAQDFEAFYQSCEITVPEDTPDPLIMNLDGKGIVMQREGLREATRKAAERERHKLKTRLSAGEKRNRKRMATVATVYSFAPHPRTAETLMGVEEAENTRIPRARNKRVWASVKREAHAVTEEVCDTGLFQFIHSRSQRVALCLSSPSFSNLYWN